jgi:arylsulfatase A
VQAPGGSCTLIMKTFPYLGLVGIALSFVTGCTLGPATVAAPTQPPNFIVLFADDLGYGDLGCFGHPTIRTPNLDRMAREGMRFTQFYAAASVCTPSRAGLLTGRLPIRNGMCSSRRRVLFPDSKGGLPANEVTIAEALGKRGYATACIGKWHLGHLPQHLPLNHGFDTYFGLPYSNDMDRVKNSPRGRQAFAAPKSEYWNVPLIRDSKIIERPAQQETLTKRYTEEAIRFIERSKDRPFFLYLPYSMVHVPLFASKKFYGQSPRGLYGDTVEEIDWSAGEIIANLKRLGIADNTLIFFTSDNGPWLPYGDHGGSAGLLKLGKGSTWEGGMREPTVAYWPAGIREPGTVTQELGSTLDIFTTCVRLAGGELPRDRVLDGVDLTPVLQGTGASPRKTMFYYRGDELWAVRHGDFKAHYKSRPGYGRDKAEDHNPPLLYNLQHDPSETKNVAKAHSDVLELMQKVVADHRATLKEVPNQLH